MYNVLYITDSIKNEIPAVWEMWNCDINQGKKKQFAVLFKGMPLAEKWAHSLARAILLLEDIVQ